MPVTAIHHVQLAMPIGEEEAARRFYGDVLGLQEVAKPAPLAGRGGVWFEAGSLRLHLGVERDFRAARKAHPAFLVEGLAALFERLRAAGHAVREDENLPGFARGYVDDPFGNRIELMAPEGATLPR